MRFHNATLFVANSGLKSLFFGQRGGTFAGECLVLSRKFELSFGRSSVGLEKEENDH
jgi:hypothetical protein